MKNLMTIIAALAVSSTVFAGGKDLKIMNMLLKIGAGSEQFMSQIHVGLDQVECSYSNISKKYNCNMTDISANDGSGAQLVLNGKKASALFNLLTSAGAQGDAGMGKAYVRAQSIRCKQAVAGVADGSASDRTLCTIDISAN